MSEVTLAQQLEQELQINGATSVSNGAQRRSSGSGSSSDDHGSHDAAGGNGSPATGSSVSAASLTSSPSQSEQPSPSESPASSTTSARSPAALSSVKTKRKKFRSRTQSEGAAWTRASFRMQTPANNTSSSDVTRNSEGSLPRLVEVLLENVEYGGASDSDDPTTRTRVPRKLSGGLTLANLVDAMEKMQRVQRMSREGCISMWLEQGEISERASEILEDARLSLHGKEKNLYNSSARRLSEAQDPMLNSLGEKLVASARNSVTLLDAPKPEPEEPLPTRMSKEELPPRHSTTAKAAPTVTTAATKKTTTAPKPEAPTRQSVPPPAPAPAATRSSLLPASVTEEITSTSSNPDQPASLNDPLRQSDFFRPESATLYHEAVRWEGVLSRRSEWLRRLEKHYYVLEGKYLRRFASKEAYIASRDEPLLQENERSARRPSSASSNPVSHLYILAGVKESASRVNGFTFITEDKKTLQLTAPTPVERVIWMRLGLEAIVAIPNLPVAPLDMEEFYAMLVVLYTAHSGKWRTEGDMAVTLPPPSEQVFTRFFRLLDRDIIFCSNYPPSVPFHGAFRGHAGVVSFIHEFSKNTAWTNFKIAGLSVEGSIAVASGKEELENKRDNRRFIQNWVHKFMFYSDGRLARFEINGDVVAASAVFKVPGAATTLKLPQEFNEVDAEHGKLGTLLVHVMHGSGLKMGVNAKKPIKEAVVVAALHHAQQTVQQQNAKDAAAAASAASTSTTTIGGISMPTLTRKFSSGISLLSGVASGNATGPPSTGEKDSDASKNSFSTGAPRNSSQASFSPMNPVWNKVIELPFHDLIGTCTLNMEVVDQGGSPSVKVGLASLNVAKYIMSSHAGGSDEEDAAMASDARWYTVSNAKGEYCGKVMVGITCRRGSSNDAEALAKPRLRKSRSVVIDRQNPPTAQMMQWDAPLTSELMGGAMTPASSYSGRGAQTPGGRMGDDQYSSHTQEYRRHGWANVKLSPESAVRPRSDGAASDKSAKKREATTAAKSSSNGRFDSVICKENEDMHTFMVCGAPFTIPRNYSLIKVCGRGAYGIVIAATNTNTGGNVAIKKVIDCIWHPHQLKQILRESRLMRHLDHENLLSLMDLIPPPSYSEFRDVYMTVDLMEMDLHRIIYSKEVLLDDHIRYFLYQILSGLNHMHKAGVLHRDLKPSNLLINSDCQLKICDLGLARSKDLDDNGMTEYVVTRWYRAPELLLGSAYGDGVDLWAAGCIFAEMLGRKPLFPGETYVHQLQLIMNVLGVPEEHSFKENPQANKLKGRQLLSRTQAGGGIDVSSMFPNANPEGLDLLWKMLVFDVEKRISVEEALRHPYLAAYYDDEKENRHVEKFKSFDLEGLDEAELKELMFKEICQFHPEEMEKRAKIQAENPEAVEKLPPGWVKRESRSVPGKFYYSNPKRGVSTWIKEEMD